MIQVCDHCGHRFAEHEDDTDDEALHCPNCGEVVEE